MYGTFGLQSDASIAWTGVSFPIPAPEPVDSYHVVIAGNDTTGFEGCSGTKADPVSAPGFVCIYPNLAANTDTGSGWGALCSCVDPSARGDGSRYGFMVQVTRRDPGLVTASGTWVYTAP